MTMGQSFEDQERRNKQNVDGMRLATARVDYCWLLALL